MIGKLLAAVDLGILVFRPNQWLAGANVAAEALLGLPIARMLGIEAATLGIGEFLVLDGNQRVPVKLFGGDGPWDVRGAKFWRDGRIYDEDAPLSCSHDRSRFTPAGDRTKKSF